MAVVVAAVGGDDTPAGHEDVGHFDGLLQQAARVAAQIQDVAAQLAAELAPGLADLLAQAVGGAVVEAADADVGQVPFAVIRHRLRSEEHTSELQSLMRNSYAVFCLKKKTK